MDLLEVTSENNKIDLFDREADTGMQFRKGHPIFSEDKHGNIEITFYTIEGDLIQYEKKGNGKMSDLNAKIVVWKQRRLKQPRGDHKYDMPFGAGTFPFLPPLLLKLYKEKTQFDTLYITEGAFKGWIAALYGIPCVGLTSITHYNSSGSKRIHPDIIKIIKQCGVKNVVVLWDGDCLDISEGDLYSTMDITRRPRGFLNAARKTADGIDKVLRAESIKLNYYFMYIKSDTFESKPKGLDDLIIAARDEGRGAENVAKDLLNISNSNPHFFKKFDITHTTSMLADHFCLNKREPMPMYNRFREQISHLEFNYFNDIYQWSDDENDLVLKAPGWAKQFKWIGDDFFKIVPQPSAHGVIEEKLIKRSKASIVDETGNRKFFTYLEHREGFCNLPDHVNYDPVHHNHYNRYSPFTHTPKEGKCDTILSFFKHIFGSRKMIHNGKEILEYELGLDYFQLLYLNPTQILPVVILYSEEGQTGKSTWGKWLRFVFGHNTIQVGNSDFKSEFNEHYSDKLLAICEETLLDRKKDVEFIKAMATSKNITVNPKGSKRYEIDFFCKFQFFSNNTRMIYLTKHETRFWILEVPLPTEDNPNILQDLCNEVPAFLQYISNRKMTTIEESRMWFNPILLKNDMFYRTVSVNEPSHAKSLRERLKADFLDFGEQEILLPLSIINKLYFGGKLEANYLKEILKDYFQSDLVRNEEGKSKQVRHYYWTWEYRGMGTDETEIVKRKTFFNGRPYKFFRADFVNPSEEPEVEEVLEAHDEDDPFNV